MNNIISSLEWRYSTKKFDENKMVSVEDIETIKNVLRLSASSFGLQPWKFVIIQNKDIQKSLLPHSWNQNQVAEASHLIILCRKNTLDETLVQDYINDYAETIQAPAANLDGYKDMMNGFLSRSDEDTKKTWAEKQLYIALGNVLTALADMKIDSCPMEGFVATEYDKVLQLEEKGLSSVLVLPIGYRAEDDAHALTPKVRFANEDLFIEM